MEILVDGKIKELSIIDSNTGCDWVSDLIGNADGFDGFDDKLDIPTMDQDNFDWWADYIETEEDIEERISELTAELSHADFEEFEAELHASGNNDMKTNQTERLNIVEGWEKKNDLD